MGAFKIGLQSYIVLGHSVVKVSQNGDNLFIQRLFEFGIFPLKSEESILFAVGNMTQYRSLKQAKN